MTCGCGQSDNLPTFRCHTCKVWICSECMRKLKGSLGHHYYCARCYFDKKQYRLLKQIEQNTRS